MRNEFKAVVKFKPISDRIFLLSLRGNQKNTFVHIHASTEEAVVETKLNFYSKLKRNYEMLPKYDLKVFLGDAT